jgi:hypothetical protein
MENRNLVVLFLLSFQLKRKERKNSTRPITYGIGGIGTVHPCFYLPGTDGFYLIIIRRNVIFEWPKRNKRFLTPSAVKKDQRYSAGFEVSSLP